MLHFNEYLVLVTHLVLMTHASFNLTVSGVDNDVLGSEISGRLGMVFT